MRMRSVAFAVFAVLAVVLPPLLGAQTPAPSPPATLTDVVQEIRGLREDLSRTTRDTVHAHLLAAHFQVQEQRVGSLGRQLADVETQLNGFRNGARSMSGEIDRISDMLSKADEPEARDQLTQRLTEIKAGLAVQQQRVQQLTAQWTELTQQYAAEQARWNDLSNELDILERSLNTR